VSRELEHIWSRVQAQLALVVDEPTYRIWLEPLRAIELSDDRLLLEAPPHAGRWIHERFGRVIQASVELVLGADASVELVTPSATATGASTRRAHATSGHSARSPSPRGIDEPTADTIAAAQHNGPLGNPKLTFEQFVIGDCNRLAHAAALTVAEMPAQAYNPLFIYGPPGVGKTHLLSSIANLLLSHNPGLTVRCTTGESFTNEFLGALGVGRADAFKLRFRDVDVLLLDDVQFLERKAKTEEEFFHTFNALHDAGRQIVLTSDRPPHDLQALEDRLRERFEAGLVADIKPPDCATRLAILRKRVQHDHIELADSHALDTIAERICSNVRALEGALIRVVAFSSLTGRPLTSELAQEVLDSLYPRSAASASRPRTIPEIQAAACEHFGLSPDEMLSSARVARIAWPRQVAMYLARELTGESLPAIGRHFGGRDHTTVLHAWRRTSARIATDDASREAVERLCKALGSPRP
jgi:chromosomal replication initiator protein